jgi:hypothetical protein
MALEMNYQVSTLLANNVAVLDIAFIACIIQGDHLSLRLRRWSGIVGGLIILCHHVAGALSIDCSGRFDQG